MNESATRVKESIAAWRRVNEREGHLARRELPAVDTAKALAYLRPAFAPAHTAASRSPRPGWLISSVGSACGMAVDLFSAALGVQTALVERDWKFCFIGGLAVQQWGRPRVTDDIDLTLLTGFGGEEKFIEELRRLQREDG